MGLGGGSRPGRALHTVAGQWGLWKRKGHFHTISTSSRMDDLSWEDPECARIHYIDDAFLASASET